MRFVIRLSAFTLVYLCVVALAAQTIEHQSASAPASPPIRNLGSGVRYVGSQVCATCHTDISRDFRQTGMGRSLVSGDDEILNGVLPLPARVYDKDSNEYYEVLSKDGHLYQSQYALDGSGQDLFRQTWRLEYVVGAGENGYGFLIRRGGHLFEAPLSYYSKTHTWSFSPGYEFYNYGFTRPILLRCISCHSGRPRPLTGQIGLYKDPPFDELAVGCENCHGPGELHVRERQEDRMMAIAPSGDADTSIVNPTRLSGWLADNICMSCHQGQDAAVLRPGSRELDFRPGMELDKVLSIFKIAQDPKVSPSSMLLEHYSGMTLSKCYRASAGGLHCTSCHDPHVQLSGTAATEFYQARCMQCHTRQSCRAGPAKRQATTPPDNCLACHMPQRTVTAIAHAALTDHTIPRQAADSANGKPEPTDQLVHLSAPFDQRNTLDSVPRLVLFEAYNELVREGHTEFQEKKNELLKELARTTPTNAVVERALAEQAFSGNTSAGLSKAIGYMEQISRRGSRNVDDSIFLAQLYARAKRTGDAIRILESSRTADPYVRKLYEMLAEQYMQLGKYADALNVLKAGIDLFPDDAKLKALDSHARSATLGGLSP
jgi:Tetratricopeptide repeat